MTIPRRSFLASLACLPTAAMAFLRQSNTLGKLSSLKGKSVSTAIYADINTGEAIGILSDLPLSNTTLKYWWYDGDAFEAAQQLLTTEDYHATVSV